MQSVARQRRKFDRKRDHLLRGVERWLETPMVVLSFVWLALLVWDLTRGLSPWMNYLSNAIWVAFILDFVLRWTLACRKLAYLKRNWITVIALVVPGLRVFRIMQIGVLLRIARATNSVRLVRVLTALNRGIRVLGMAMGERGFGYVVAMTVIVTFAGAAAMYAFENHPGGRGLNDYGTALWWTAMIMTTMGSEYWPQSPEGRILCLLLAIYAFAIFGYVTATIASFLVGRETRASSEPTLTQIKQQLDALQEQVKQLNRPQNG